MAEIHVEPKKHQSTPAWIWILVAVVVVALVAYFLTRDNATTDENTRSKSNTTSYVQPQPTIEVVSIA